VVTGGNPLAADLPPGSFVVQDEASQVVPLLVAARAGARILDACAAPGGKTIAIASAVQGDATIVASDLRPRRLALLRSTLANAGVTGAVVVRADAERALPFARVFDAVLLDAPCSGLGTLRRDPEIRWRRQPDDLARLAAAQYRMLCNAAAVVRSGGEIVYSTCSSEPEENEEVVAAFLEGNRAFRLVSEDDVRRRLPRPVQALIDERGYLRTSPPRHGLEAFFGAILTHRS
jgi:16S rRNA (cytosine967-C5)-methyltransferase